MTLNRTQHRKKVMSLFHNCNRFMTTVKKMTKLKKKVLNLQLRTAVKQKKFGLLTLIMIQ